MFPQLPPDCLYGGAASQVINGDDRLVARAQQRAGNARLALRDTAPPVGLMQLKYLAGKDAGKTVVTTTAG